jgi:hypothetical protein
MQASGLACRRPESCASVPLVRNVAPGALCEVVCEGREWVATMQTDESELIAQQVSGLSQKLAELERRVAESERVNARLEQAALITARALQEISGHWDAVYEAMRREEIQGEGQLESKKGE